MTDSPVDAAWHTSVTELVSILQESFISLVPILERSHVPWRDGDSYDQWDAIAEVLFATLCREPLEWAIGSDLGLAPYDMEVADYSDCSFIVALHQELPPGRAALQRLRTVQMPFDTIEVALLDQGFHATGSATVPLRECRFEVSVPQAAEARHLFDRLIVPA